VRTGRRPRKLWRRSSTCPVISASAAVQALRAPRANRAFCTDEKRIRPENAVTVNTKHSVGDLYKIADCVRTVRRPHKLLRCS